VVPLVDVHCVLVYVIGSSNYDLRSMQRTQFSDISKKALQSGSSTSQRLGLIGDRDVLMNDLFAWKPVEQFFLNFGVLNMEAAAVAQGVFSSLEAFCWCASLILISEVRSLLRVFEEYLQERRKKLDLLMIQAKC